MSDTLLEVREVSKTFTLGSRKTLKAVENVSFGVEQNSICVLLGPSGCGKSTVLRNGDRRPCGTWR